MPCYTYRTYRSASPRLTSVPRAYVLTMAGSRRLEERERLERLCGLARETVVQVNHRGAPGCTKPACCAQKSNFDLVHAYQAACAHARALGDAPVLFLEDDAVVRPDARADEWASVDAFLRRASFDVYTLGSIGVVPPWGRVGDHYSLLVLWHTQATVWSPSTRRRLLAADVCDLPHVDAHFLSRQPRKFKYKRPLIVQTFPESENSQQWCLRCQDDAFGELEKWGATMWSRWYRAGLGLHGDPIPGWDVLNRMTHMAFALLLVVGVLAGALAVAACAALAIRARPRRAQTRSPPSGAAG